MKSLFRSSQFPIILLLTITCLIGLIILNDYGESWDEPDIYRYGEYTLNAYQFFFHPQDLPLFDGNLDHYGPAYFLLATILARGLVSLIPTWTIVTAWHFFYLITFLAAIYILYLLSRRWMSAWAAFGVALLFLTQPLLWGHAFINPKDIPFLAFFMASIFLGFEMVDAPPRTARRVVLLCAAGIVLGLTISFRVLGPLAGLITLIYAVIKSKQKVLSLSIAYLFIAGISAYLTWPFLWTSPIINFLLCLKIMSQYPFGPKVLFLGELYRPHQLPRSYAPILFGLQLTEPALILILAGLAVMFLSFRQKEKTEPILLFIGWFLIPALMIIGFKSNLYDNARQLYFLLPPIFFTTGFALDLIFKYLTRPVIRGAFLAFAILPGLLAGAWLHPYEYVYYNSLIGGTAGASRQFETDYWGLSFREAVEYINTVAPYQSQILVLSGPDSVTERYARPDLQITTKENDLISQEKYTYILILTRKGQNDQRCNRSDVVHRIGRNGVVFTIIKKLGPKERCQ
jgi:hypothetical protein